MLGALNQFLKEATTSLAVTLRRSGEEGETSKQEYELEHRFFKRNIEVDLDTFFIELKIIIIIFPTLPFELPIYLFITC